MKTETFALWILFSLFIIFIVYFRLMSSGPLNSLRSARFKLIIVKIIILLGLLITMLIRS
jgi:hypothetical protein